MKIYRNRITDALHLTDKSVTSVDPPFTNFLAIDKDGELVHGDFGYISIVGQLNYLQVYSQLDITMAVTQVACFVHTPKRSHELALIRIGRYLKETADKGLILNQTMLSHSKLTSLLMQRLLVTGESKTAQILIVLNLVLDILLKLLIILYFGYRQCK